MLGEDATKSPKGRVRVREGGRVGEGGVFVGLLDRSLQDLFDKPRFFSFS